MKTERRYTDEQLIALARESDDCDDILGMEMIAQSEEAKQEIRRAWWNRHRADDYEWYDDLD